jgi:hypothetical protein
MNRFRRRLSGRKRKKSKPFRRISRYKLRAKGRIVRLKQRKEKRIPAVLPP